MLEGSLGDDRCDGGALEQIKDQVNDRLGFAVCQSFQFLRFFVTTSS